MSVDVGIDFRATAGFVTDPANCTYCIADVYPTTRGGATFGWRSTDDVATAPDARDRDSLADARVAGINFQPNSNKQSLFTLDLPNGAGTYIVHLAMGDGIGGNYQTNFFQVKDGATVLIDESAGVATGATQFCDATGTLITASSFFSSETGVSCTFAGTKLTLLIGSTTTQIQNTCVAFLRITQAGGGLTFQTVWAKEGLTKLMSTGVFQASNKTYSFGIKPQKPLRKKRRRKYIPLVV